MTRIEYFNSLNNYKDKKSNYLQHAQSTLYGTTQDNHKYYKRIGEPGNYRYFYTKEAWDAFAKELSTKTNTIENNQNALWKTQLAEQGRAKIAEIQNKPTAEEENRKKNEYADLAKKVNEAINNKDRNTAIKLMQSAPYLKDLIKDMKNKLSNGEKRNSVLTELCEGKYKYDTENMKNINKDLYYSFIDNMLWSKADEFAKTIKKNQNDLANRDAAIAAGQKSALEYSKQQQDKITDPVKYQKVLDESYDTYMADINAGESKDYWEFTEFITHRDNLEENYNELIKTQSKLREREEKDPNNGLPLLPEKLSYEEAMKMVNPGRASGIWDLNGGGNCSLCTLTMDLRMRGYDVSAPSTNMVEGEDYKETSYRFGKTIPLLDDLTNWSNYGSVDDGALTSVYKGKVSTILDKNDDKEKLKELVGKQTNSYGYLGVQWNEEDYGHAMFYAVDSKGTITIYDGQINQSFTVDEILDQSHGYVFTRTDNLEINYDFLKENGWIIYE